MSSNFDALLLRVFQDAKRLGENFPIEVGIKLSERRILRAKISRPDPVIFDIGSNLGSSIAFYRSLYPRARIFGFEPDPDTFARLSARHGRDGGVQLFNKALGDRVEHRQLNRNSISSTNSLHAVDESSAWVQSSAVKTMAPVEVAVDTLDNVTRELGVDRIDFMKSDTQGHEPEVLTGAQGMLEARRIGLMKLEVQPGDFYLRRVSLFRLEQMLYPLGYNLMTICDIHVDAGASMKYFDAFFEAGDEAPPP